MVKSFKNAVLDDQELISALKSIHPVWGDMTVRVAGEAWGMPLLDQKTKALITIAIDQMALNINSEGSPFSAHIDMALKQGAAYEEIEELIILHRFTQYLTKVQLQLPHSIKYDTNGEMFDGNSWTEKTGSHRFYRTKY